MKEVYISAAIKMREEQERKKKRAEGGNEEEAQRINFLKKINSIATATLETVFEVEPSD